MSDQELVTLNSTQFNRLDLLLQAGTNALWAINEQLKTSNSNAEILKAIETLTRKVDTMSSNIDRIEKEAADMAENVGLVRTAIEGLKSVQEAMTAEIESLKQQVAQGQLDQSRLDAAAAVFEKADEDLDALVVPPTPPTEPPTEPTEPSGRGR